MDKHRSHFLDMAISHMFSLFTLYLTDALRGGVIEYMGISIKSFPDWPGWQIIGSFPVGRLKKRLLMVADKLHQLSIEHYRAHYNSWLPHSFPASALVTPYIYLCHMLNPCHADVIFGFSLCLYQGRSDLSFEDDYGKRLTPDQWKEIGFIVSGGGLPVFYLNVLLATSIYLHAKMGFNGLTMRKCYAINRGMVSASLRLPLSSTPSDFIQDDVAEDEE